MVPFFPDPITVDPRRQEPASRDDRAMVVANSIERPARLDWIGPLSVPLLLSVALLTFLFACLLGGVAFAQQLPGEDTLPGQVKSSAPLPGESALPESPPKDPGPKESGPVEPKQDEPGEKASDPGPSESEIPGFPPVEQGNTFPGEDQLVPEANQHQLVDPATVAGWPGETSLPVAAPQQQDDDEDEKQEGEQLPAIGQKPEGQPWLRLNMRGHTGTVLGMSFTRDSQYLGSGGTDKSLEIWTRLAPQIDPARPWLHERTIRWQVHRAARGRIYSVAAGNSYVAFAGEAADSRLGSIMLVDPVNGNLNRALIDDEIGHRQVVAGLSFSPDDQADMLVSQDLEGCSVLWKSDPDTGLWSAHNLFQADRHVYNAQEVQALAPWRRFVPIVWAGPRRIVVARPVEPIPLNAPPRWKLVMIDADQPERKFEIRQSDIHQGMVMAMAASPDGRKLVTADARVEGVLQFWDLASGRHVDSRTIAGPTAISLDFSRDGRLLLVGTKVADAPNRATAEVALVDVRDMMAPRRLSAIPVASNVRACAMSPDGERYAYSQENRIHVVSLTGANGRGDRAPVASQELGPSIRPPRRVAFALEAPHYRVAIGYGGSGYQEVFDPSQVQLGRQNRIDATQWLPSTWGQGQGRQRWTLESVQDQRTKVYTHQLKLGGTTVTTLPLVPALHGSPTATCWIPDRQGKPFAVAVGTDGRNNIYVYRLSADGNCPLLRQFRGHWATVTSLSVSRDLRYLVSASDDSTIRFWKLEDYQQGVALTNRWGATAEIADGALVTTTVREDGVLFGRGLRSGDRITRLQWYEGAQSRDSNDPEGMLQALRDMPFDSIVSVSYRRGNDAEVLITSFPAWPPVTSLFVTDEGEWAYWTPAGYYDASFNGHKMFGWQINHGDRLLPEFFLAAQLRQALERPEIMEKVLDAGSLEAAFRMADLRPPVDASLAVVDEYRVKPRIEILSPTERDRIDGDVVDVRAAITVRDGLRLAPPKVFANGVVGVNRRLIGMENVPGGRRYTFQWEARLPSDPRIVLQVIAATDARVAAIRSVALPTRELRSPGRGRMFVFAAGVNRYRDAQIQGLDFAVNNASSFVRLLRTRGQAFYDSHVASLLDGHVTRSMWNVVTEQYAEQIRRQVSPDDVLMVYLSGHGVRDEDTGQYYYVTSNARYADIMARRYGDCMSLEDFASFDDIPCRKLVILDTCHSGAVQPLEQRNLKAAIRALQDDMVLTLTASDGNQEAVEESQRQLGRFTYQLLQALDGAADSPNAGGDGDKVVTFRETVNFVKQAVHQDSVGDTYRQTPTAGPVELLPYVDLPLTRGD